MISVAGRATDIIVSSNPLLREVRIEEADERTEAEGADQGAEADKTAEQEGDERGQGIREDTAAEVRKRSMVGETDREIIVRGDAEVRGLVH